MAGPVRTGHPHRYFHARALDRGVLKPKATKAQVVEAMKGHVLAEAQVDGAVRTIGVMGGGDGQYGLLLGVDALCLRLQDRRGCR